MGMERRRAPEIFIEVQQCGIEQHRAVLPKPIMAQTLRLRNETGPNRPRRSASLLPFRHAALCEILEKGRDRLIGRHRVLGIEDECARP